MRSKSVPFGPVETTTALSLSSRPCPEMMRTPASTSEARMSSDCWRASESRRLLTAPRLIAISGLSGLPSLPRANSCTPRSPARVIATAASAVAMSVLDGTTSVITAEPPMPARSTTVTSAPSCAAASRGFVAAGAATDDRDALGALEAQRHALILPAGASARHAMTSGRGQARHDMRDDGCRIRARSGPRACAFLEWVHVRDDSPTHSTTPRPTRSRSRPKPRTTSRGSPASQRHDIALTLGSGWGQAAELIGETIATLPCDGGHRLQQAGARGPRRHAPQRRDAARASTC